MPKKITLPKKLQPLSQRSNDHGDDLRRLQADFLARMGTVQQFRQLFDHLPDVHFFAKDLEGRCMVGSGWLWKRLGYSSEEELIGKTDADFHPPRIVEDIRRDDEMVVRTRKPLVDRVEALFTRNQAKDWYVTTKLPIIDAAGEVMGIMGFVRPYRNSAGASPGCERIERLVEYIQKHHARHIEAEELAKIGCVSVRQLNRIFQKTFGMNTQTFLIRTRVQAASDDLAQTDKLLSEIAVEHGFCDQSAFSRRFQQHTGETPLKFRQRMRRTGVITGK
jgi:PAS domain S-box-containing protein